MNKRYKKMLATGLALNMMLINIPYNVFANSDIIENVVLSEDNISLIGEQSKSDLDNLVIEDEQVSNNKDLTIEESDSSYINNEVTSEILKPVIEESSNMIENNINENILNSTTDFAEDKKIVKSTIPSVTNYADSFAGGNGTEENPYQISNALELARIAYLVNDLKIDTEGMYFDLINDIDLNGFDADDDASNGNWIPIGIDLDKRFKGNLNGNEYEILNMNIKSFKYSGLFGVAENISIKNLNFKNFYIADGIENGFLIGNALGIIEITDINGVNNLIVNTTKNGSAYVGGLIGRFFDSSIDSSINSYINIENIELEANIKFIDCNGYSTGGLIGSIYSKTDINVKNININLILEGRSDYRGGVIGSCMIKNGALDRILNFENISINIDFLEQDKDSLYNSHSLGGFIAYMSGSMEYVTLMKVKNVDIFINNNTVKNISTFSPFIAETRDFELDLDNINITGENNIDAKNYSGGLIADCIASKGIKVNNVNIDMDFLSKYYGGGLCGYLSSVDYLYINNFNYKGKLTSTSDRYGYMYGGAIGCCQSTKNVEVLNSNIDAVIESDYFANYAGGLIGYLGVSKSFLSKNNIIKIDIDNSQCSGGLDTYEYLGGLIGYVYSSDGNIEVLQNGIYLSIKPDIYTTKQLYVGGIMGQILNLGKTEIHNNFVIGNIDAIPNSKGYLTTSVYNSGEMSVSNIYFVLNMGDGDSIDERDTYLYTEVKGNEITLNNIYYNSDISSLSDNIAIPLTTEQMQGYPTYENMDFDFENIWKANKEFYPTFEQLNTAPELSGSDIELILNQEYNLLDYVTVEDFEDKDLNVEIKETDLDITKIGNYTAKFTVTDPKGLSNELTLNIKVVAERPIINAKDLTLYIGDKFNSLDKVTAIDINGNDITEHIKVIENTVDTTKKGVYKVVYQVDSLERLSTTKEIKVTVLEKESNNNSNSNKVESDNNESSTTDKPQTGDNFIVYGISLLASLVGLFCINRKNKK